MGLLREKQHLSHHRMPIHAALSQLEFTEVIVTCTGGGGLIAMPTTIGKIRGAFGQALFQMGCGGEDQCRWTSPCAYHGVFRSHAELRPGKTLPCPYVIRTERAGPRLAVSVLLTGRATGFAGEVAGALTAGLRRGLSGVDEVLDVQGREIVPLTGLTDRGITAQATLVFETPVLVRNSDTGGHITPSAVLRSLIHRADGVARWNGIKLEADFPALLNATEAIAGAWSDVRPKRWTRGAVRQKRKVPMEGAEGRMHLQGDLARFSHFITLGEVFHCGSRVPWGLGRYRVEHGL